MPDIFLGEEENKPQENTHDDSSSHKNDAKKELVKAGSEELNKGIPALKEDKKHNHTHLFAAYCENPKKVSFADKLEDEEILLFLRGHFVVNIPWIIKAILLGLVPMVIFAVNMSGIIDVSFLTPNYLLMILLFYYFLIVGYIFVNYLTWFYNISLVTSKRIVDIDFSQIVFENVDATKLTQVEDVGYVQVGVIRSIFDYGDVHLHTAGPASDFEFLAVPHPERVLKVINNLIGEANNA